MTATKLRKLLEAASPGCDCMSEELMICVHRTEALQDLEAAAPALARLVLQLSETLTAVMALIEAEQEPQPGATLEATIAARAALAAVEEL